ncbi:MAG: 30S ribosomal protein S6 [Patescibacteria group bacterium]|nr:30S ribosomal protein S6 [Patescibacteria group bacterium]
MEDNYTNTYELTLLFSPDLSEIDLAKAIDKVKKSISSKEGDIKKEHSWGKKKLAYRIKKLEFGNYHTLVYTMPKESVNEIIRELELSSDVLRHMNLSLEKEGITIDDLFTPEKETAMIAASVKEKMDPKTATVKKEGKKVTEKPKTEEKKIEEPKEKLSPEEQEKRRKELDEKLSELLEDKEE